MNAAAVHVGIAQQGIDPGQAGQPVEDDSPVHLLHQIVQNVGIVFGVHLVRCRLAEISGLVLRGMDFRIGQGGQHLGQHLGRQEVVNAGVRERGIGPIGQGLARQLRIQIVACEPKHGISLPQRACSYK